VQELDAVPPDLEQVVVHHLGGEVEGRQPELSEPRVVLPLPLARARGEDWLDGVAE
jgi:hypothetical protein